MTASSPAAADSSSATTPSTSAGSSTSIPETTSSTTQQTTPTSTSTTEAPPTSTSTTPTTSDTPTSTSTQSSATPSSTTTIPSTSTTPSSSTTTTNPPTTSSVIFTTTQVSTGENGSTAFITVTSTQLNTNTAQSTAQASSTDTSGSVITSSASQSGAIAEPAKIAVAVVVPIAAVALLVIGGIFFWRKRKQRMDAAEERRKEVEDYSYNPNNDPTLPDMGAGAAAGAYEMKEDGGSSGYRGWGSTTLAGSTGRKASTTMSGGAAGVAYSDATSPTRGNFSDTRSGDGLMGEGSQSPQEGEILGAMGPGAVDNRGNDNGNVHRGPSNASSSYSAAGRSDGSGENTGSYSGPAYLDQYGGNNPYADGAYGQQRPGELGGQPVIRDNPARRNTRIENPSHYPQQSAGISQNF
ncbi:uncharacterized protein GGS22DRAFT_181016 [Annulohypoxylon maeteangense]|uniref:uncharacterized protein n=1 Tax=Annulohypoxylon maeteangense TaxID=1927788 RepID=UPI0020083D19|nr:uncharacterized protein GGS22DRAFT_181016 [Annulohypoxylon maeteangense]KAI0882411.1 hypothetical protein GGS22DRAFT_181016 [Annulohypoxylon maeteangense]